ncbi:uncharacterized protein LOC130796657 [Actinidia eriantha]|uniref:uncharacterized protein LOC130796657 n=1 Tax=Actinidia eriantha TaxID=165200 RepID=UPI002587857C|nr:uncharacterized protein LOC130796657 [Actinidia eriantha]
MIVASWNIRGMNKSLKQNGILEFTLKNKVDIMRILETKLKHQRTRDAVKHKFRRWAMWDNFQQHPMELMEELCSYGRQIEWISRFRSARSKRPLWTNLDRFNETLNDPWLVLGDFNNELNIDERSNDQQFTGAYLTWTNNSTWCKLDRAMINNKWISNGLRAHDHFGFLGKLSGHSPCMDSKKGVGYPYYGSAMFRLCRKLKLLKEPLKELNRKHFSHISSRAAAAETKLYEIQQQLHDNPTDLRLQDQMVEVKLSAFKLAEAERSFYSQLAKMKYLRYSDKDSKFFHDLIKSNMNKGQIVSITLSAGSRSTSQQEDNESFIKFYKNLLGSSSSCTPIDSHVLLDGMLLDEDQASALICAISNKEIKESLFSIGDDKAPRPDGFSTLL